MQDVPPPVPGVSPASRPLPIDWEGLQRLRSIFLSETPPVESYWKEDSLLTAYDQTFGKRISWKWDTVLHHLHDLGWQPPPGPVLDWGCGTGVAVRAFLAWHPTAASGPIHLWDRSPRAVTFASRRLREAHPDVLESLDPPGGINLANDEGVLLLSHILTELSQESLEELLALVHRFTAIIWVEPGTYQASRRLSAIRDSLVPPFHPFAPCTHRNRCGVLTAGQEAHWCHHFARVPTEAFTDPDWSRFSNLMGIDLRRLPFSYLVLDKRRLAQPPVGARILGLPRQYKGFTRILSCEESGIHDRELQKRDDPKLFRQLKKGAPYPTYVWRLKDSRIVGVESSPPASGPSPLP